MLKMGSASFSRKWTFQLLMVILHLVAGEQLITPVVGSSYVVYMGAHSDTSGTTTEALLNFQVHQQKLLSLFGIAASESVFHSYSNFNAFAAHLSPEQAATLAAQEDVISVFPNTAHKLHTTHSWSFLGLEDSFGHVPENSLWTKSDFGKDVIIGVLDTGVWPESASFNDEGFDPIPARWKGECTVGDRFGPENCNKKLIGARYFVKGFEAAEGPLNTTETGDFLSARDLDGHGTHTTSTAGGSFAPNVSCLGFAPGTAKGGAPKARVAMYKVCWPGCYGMDVLSGFDQAISDGVDVFSVSLGFGVPSLDNVFNDGIFIGSFHAAQKNISTICSAGNDGPTPSTVENIAPWITTVAASSVDRDFPSYAILGNGVSLKGQSLSTSKLDDTFSPLVYAENVFAASSNSTQSMLCLPGTLDPAQVTGKIVACMGGEVDPVVMSEVVKQAGGAGLLHVFPFSSPFDRFAFPFVIPAAGLTYAQGLVVLSYIKLTKSPVAKLTPATTELANEPAPIVAAFSSQGPNSLIPDLLKPDVAGPGLNILAAFDEADPFTNSEPGDFRFVKYNIISGTSMACPHVTGVTASLRAYHPTWTPAAIHSAIMTSASVDDNYDIELISMNPLMQLNTPFGIGAGTIAPNRAAEPGLVYDNAPNAYLEFLCSLNYNTSQIVAITNQKFTCTSGTKSVSDFNYPSLTVSRLGNGGTFTRTVTNVGNADSVYTVKIVSPPGIITGITPSELKFSALGETKTFEVRFEVLKSTEGSYVFGSYTWSDGLYIVRSPIVINTGSSEKVSQNADSPDQQPSSRTGLDSFAWVNDTGTH